MRVVPLLILIGSLITVSIAGCVLAVSPMNRFPYGQQEPAPKPEAAPKETREERQTRRECETPPVPLHDKRPVIQDFTEDDVKDPKALNAKLIAHIKKLDGYIDGHQKKEDQAFADWKEKCRK